MACPTGKQRFRDDFEAKLALHRVSTDTSPRRREKRAYRCPRCHGWHLTSQTKRSRKANQ